MTQDPYRDVQRAAKKGDDVRDALARVDADGAALEVKAERLGVVLRSLAEDDAALEAEAKRVAQKRRALAQTDERLKRYIVERMKGAGIERITCPAFSLWIKESECVVVDDEAAIPPDFVRVKTVREPNKVLILERHRANGETVPGTHVEKSQNLQVK